VRRNLFVSCLLVFVLASAGFVVLFEANSSMCAKTYYGGTINSLIATSDGGYTIAGHIDKDYRRDDFLLVKLDEFGEMVWVKTYSGPLYDSASLVIETSDGGYAIAGYTTSFSGAGRDFWLVKTDAYGNMEWNQTYEDGDYSVSAVVETSDGGYAIAGGTWVGVLDSSNSRNLLLIKTDASGNVEWNQIFWRWWENELCSALVETSDGGYAIAGYSGEPSIDDDYSALLVKFDTYGNVEWSDTHSPELTNRFNSLIETSDGGLAMAGQTGRVTWDGYYYSEFWLVKTDASGKMEWSQTYNRPDFMDIAQLLIETSDGGYVVAGRPPRSCAGENDTWLVKTDAYGNMEWNQTYEDKIVLLIEPSGGGYKLAGVTSTVTEPYRVWSIITDEFGVGIEFNFPDKVSPTITVDSPTNQTYTTDNVTLTFNVDEDISWMHYSLDGQDNVTITETTITLTGLTNGSHSIIVYAKDKFGNVGASETIIFTVNTVTDPTPDTTPDTNPDTTPDTNPDSNPDTTPDTSPDTNPDTNPDANPDSNPTTDSGIPSTWHMIAATIGIAAIASITILLYLTRIRKNKKHKQLKLSSFN